jgi:hypothetical protein
MDFDCSIMRTVTVCPEQAGQSSQFSEVVMTSQPFFSQSDRSDEEDERGRSDDDDDEARYGALL